MYAKFHVRNTRAAVPKLFSLVGLKFRRADPLMHLCNFKNCEQNTEII